MEGVTHHRPLRVLVRLQPFSPITRPRALGLFSTPFEQSPHLMQRIPIGTNRGSIRVQFDELMERQLPIGFAGAFPDLPVSRSPGTRPIRVSCHVFGRRMPAFAGYIEPFAIQIARGLDPSYDTQWEFSLAIARVVGLLGFGCEFDFDGTVQVDRRSSTISENSHHTFCESQGQLGLYI